MDIYYEIKACMCLVKMFMPDSYDLTYDRDT